MIRVWAGRPHPLGASFDGRGTNFALFSAHATRVQLCLFEPSGKRQIECIDLPEMTDEVFHGYLPDIGPGQLYGYRVHGPYEPENGHRFNPNKLLLDPYAGMIAGAVRWSNAHFGYRVGSSRADLSFDRSDSASGMLKGVVIDPSFAWGDDQPPGTRWDETVIYEAHVKGLTRSNVQVAPQLRGSYAGLGDAAVLDHLVQLGVTAIELLPVHTFLDDRHLLERGLRNYWGYNSIGFFAPEPRYFSATPALAEFQAMVRRLHSAGIEVILDVVYNHTAEGNQLGPTLSFRGIDNASYYRLMPDQPRFYDDLTGCGNALNLTHPRVLQMVMDSLRYWVRVMHVDGFRFDLCSTLGREAHGWDPHSSFFDAIRQDPDLQSVKLIAEPWDIGPGGYQLGAYGPGWSEWNDRYRDTVRAFWRGDEAVTPEFSARILGSADTFSGRGRRPWSSINFVTAHDGFCLDDLVSYNDKHNTANGEDNRDGHSHNLSWNCGVEGETDDDVVITLRARQKRNLLGTLLLSQGTPMLLAGDEIGHGQHGNNNVYCQDNELAWIDWRSITADDRELLQFVRGLLALRRAHPVLRRASYLHGRDRSAQGIPDIVWWRADGGEMTAAEWENPQCRTFGMMLTGHAGVHLPPEGLPERDQTFLLLFHAGAEDADFSMPASSESDGWQRVLDSADPNLRLGARLWREADRFRMLGRSFSVFMAGRRSRTGGVAHSMPFGAEVLEGGVTRFRLWAPSSTGPSLLISDAMADDDWPAGRRIPMQAAEQPGWFEVLTDAAAPGSRYAFLPDASDLKSHAPDPAARAQLGGPHRMSVVVDPAGYRWRVDGWRGRAWEETVLMEIHVGTFSPEGTFDGARQRLAHLARTGITAVELMPIATFGGLCNWGYDGVLPFAPDHSYGGPDALKAFIDEAHRLNLQVLLDVVYNHFGPDGNYLHLTAPAFYRDDLETPWGQALDFRNSTVRSFFVHNALFWLTEYRFDGLRLDAVHAISADSRRVFLDELSYAVNQRFGSDRHVHLILENEDNDAGLLESAYTAQWNDDIHHCLHVLLTGETEGYFADYAEAPAESLARGLTEGFVFQGQPMSYRNDEPRGMPSAHLPPQRFIAFAQNHDQIGNRAMGERLTVLADPQAVRAARAIILLSPQIPMLFMGEEWGATTPFQFFTGFGGELGEAVRQGRRREFSRFAAFADETLAAAIPDPEDPATFARSHLDWSALDTQGARDSLAETMALVAVRQQLLIPMLRKSRATEARAVGTCGIQVGWKFGARQEWHLLAQLGTVPGEGFKRPPGDPVWSTGNGEATELAHGRMPAWSVIVYCLDRPARTRPARADGEASPS